MSALRQPDPGSVRTRWRDRWGFLAVFGVVVTWPAPAWAQYISQFFPSGVPGYQDETGVTVASRLRAPYEPQGVHVGDFLLNANLGKSLGYRSNVAGFAGAPGSWFAETAPSATIVSDWSRDQLGAAVTVDNTRYFSTPRQNTTDWTVAIGGGYTIGRENLTAGYSHLSLHELPNAIGSPLSQTPIPYTVDDARLSYAFDQGRFKVIPRVDVQLYQYGDATVLGVPISQSFDNRVVATAGVETHYALTDQHSLLFVARGTESRYTDTPAGQPTNNSQSILALAGIDYQADGPWRYRLACRHRAARFRRRAIRDAHRADRRGERDLDADGIDDGDRDAVTDDRGSRRSLAPPAIR